MTTVNEQTTSYVTVSFYDKTGVLASPSSVRYRIDCDTNKQQVKDWTAIGASSSIEIEIDTTENVIINQRHQDETRIVTVEATYNVSDKVTEEYSYTLNNLNYLS